MHMPITNEMIFTGQGIMKPEEYYFKSNVFSLEKK